MCGMRKIAAGVRVQKGKRNMNTSGIFDRMKGLFADLTGKNRFGKEDFVLLKTALMLAAVDGEVGADEVGRFKELAEKCRGYNGESFEVLWEQALRSAGYLLIQSRFLGEDEIAEAFVKEAEKDFVGTVVLETKDEHARAFELLDRMAMADGDYSKVERACIAALAKRVKVARDQAIAERYPRASRFDVGK